MPITKIKKLKRQVEKKSTERLTIMLIPHGSRSSFSWHLNWTFIVFALILLLSLSFLAIYTSYEHYQTAHEKSLLKQKYGSNLELTLKMEKLSKKKKKKFLQLIQNIKKLSMTIGLNKSEVQYLEAYWQKQRLKIKPQKESQEITQNKSPKEKFLSPRSQVLPPIQILDFTSQKAHFYLSVLFNMEKWFSQGYFVYKQIPLGRPFLAFTNLRDTSGFGKRINPINQIGYEFHSGFDTAGPVGTPIYAVASGKVHKSYYHPNGYGRTIILEHGFGFYSVYAHLSKMYVRAGMKVQKYKKIGAMGNSGRTTGSHLHYEIHKGLHNRMNPISFICIDDLFQTNKCLRYQQQQNN